MKTRNTKLTDSERCLIKSSYLDEGMSYRDIHEKYGYSSATIGKVVKGLRTTEESLLVARSNNKKYILTEEGRRTLSENGKKASMRSGKFWTKPEREFKKILNDIDIGVIIPEDIAKIIGVDSDNDFSRNICFQFPIQRYVCDFVDVENKTVFNINGDYWHANPLLYDARRLGKMQKINIRQDKNKRVYLIKKGWNVVDIWESEIYWNCEFVKEEVRAVSAKKIEMSFCDFHQPEDWSNKLQDLWFKKNRKSRNMDKVSIFCKNCNISFLISSSQKTRRKYCSRECYIVANRKVERPSKEELEKMIDTMSWCAIGRKYNVSDNAVRKWAKAYGI